MTAQELKEDGRSGATADAAFEADLDRQRRLFREREDELLARYPEKFIAVCGGEVFVGDDDGEAMSKAEAAHPDRAVFMRLYDPAFVPAQDYHGEDSAHSADAAFEADLDRQRRLFREREDELLARYPEKFIAVCGGEVFVGDDDGEAMSKAEAAHPDRAVFMRLHDPVFWC